MILRAFIELLLYARHELAHLLPPQQSSWIVSIIISSFKSGRQVEQIETTQLVNGSVETQPRRSGSHPPTLPS